MLGFLSQNSQGGGVAYYATYYVFPRTPFARSGIGIGSLTDSLILIPVDSARFMVDLALSPGTILAGYPATFVSTSPGDSLLSRMIDLAVLLAFRHDLALFVSSLQDLVACDHYFAPMGHHQCRLGTISYLALACSLSGLCITPDSHQYPGGIDSQHQLIWHHSCRFGTIDFGIIVSTPALISFLLAPSAVETIFVYGDGFAK